MGKGTHLIQLHLSNCSTMCTATDVYFGKGGSGINMIVEEVRLEWLPLSQSTNMYDPPVTYFYVRHFRDFPKSTEWTKSTRDLQKIYDVVYQKQISNSSLELFWSISYSLYYPVYNFTDSLQFPETNIEIKFNNISCSPPLTFTYFVNLLNTSLTSPATLHGSCFGLSKGHTDISLNVNVNNNETLFKVSTDYSPHLIVSEVKL